MAKPRLGKNSYHEGIKTKRDIAHDHHLSRKGKGEHPVGDFMTTFAGVIMPSDSHLDLF